MTRYYVAMISFCLVTVLGSGEVWAHDKQSPEPGENVRIVLSIQKETWAICC